MRYLKFGFILAGVILFLTGCNAIRKLDKSDEYKKTDAYDKALVLPSDITNESIENLYPVPKVECKDYNVSTLPPGSKLIK